MTSCGNFYSFIGSSTRSFFGNSHRNNKNSQQTLKKNRRNCRRNFQRNSQSNSCTNSNHTTKESLWFDSLGIEGISKPISEAIPEEISKDLRKLLSEEMSNFVFFY